MKVTDVVQGLAWLRRIFALLASFSSISAGCWNYFFWTKKNLHIIGRDVNFQYESYPAARQCPAAYSPNKNWELVLDYTRTFSLCPDLSLCDYYLFGSLKEAFRKQRFDDNAAVEAFVRNWLVSQPSSFYDSGIKNCRSVEKNVFLSPEIM